MGLQVYLSGRALSSVSRALGSVLSSAIGRPINAFKKEMFIVGYTWSMVYCYNSRIKIAVLNLWVVDPFGGQTTLSP